MKLGGWKSYSMVQTYARLGPEHLAVTAEKVNGGWHKKRHTQEKKI
jgi:hypothetical protein